MSTPAGLITVIIPTFNGARRVGKCLDALVRERGERNVEIIVVDDGSTDDIASTISAYNDVRLIRQANAGPAAARNRGAREAHGAIILFIDDDCVPSSGWLDAMLAPFSDVDVVAVKGAYRTNQKSLVARFVQMEYEDRYRLMSGFPNIDFVDTYSAAFRRERFLETGGYDTSFPIACAEDAELSYRMALRGWKMKFAPNAIVYHTHPESLASYMRKKYKFAFWRMLAVRKNPGKGLRDSHTPQVMKLQVLFLPLLLFSLAFDFSTRHGMRAMSAVVTLFLLTTLPFVVRAMRKDLLVAALSPVLLAFRSCAQLAGVVAGAIHARDASRVTSKSPA